MVAWAGVVVKNELHRGLKWPVAPFGGALGLGVVCALLMFANAADVSTRNREELLLRNGVATYLDEVARRTVSETLWDEAVENLDVSFDPNWAEANIGEYFSATEGFETTAVLDRTDAPRYAMLHGETVSADAIQEILTAAAPLVHQVRAGETRRGPIQPLLERLDGANPAPIYASAILTTDQGLFAVTATLVQPDVGESTPSTGRSAIVIAGEAVDKNFLGLLADRYTLQDARLSLGALARPRGWAATPLNDISGRSLGAIQWRPQQPGREMLDHALPFVLAALTLLALIAWWFQSKSRKAAERMIASEARTLHLAYHDALTGLPNRLLLAERLDQALALVRSEQRPFAVHCIDLDRFKEVNDSFGHQAGDDLIRTAARLFASVCGPADTLARLGGDEFAIIQADATPEAAHALASRLVEIMAEPVEIAVGRVFVGCSVGLALACDDRLDGQECLRQSDLALYRAKEAGRGRCAMFEPEMDASLRTRREIRDELRGALERGELSLVYQPQVHHGAAMFGVEALLRWNHPVRGAVSPSVFVPIAEESGLIEALGMFTLRRAFEDSKRLTGLRVAVNVSAAQLRLKDFVPKLAALAAETNVDAARIELEITEGLLLGDDPLTHQALVQVRALGFRIALDDFGTGYSSLSYLQRYPIDKIKIDRSFIANLGLEANADAVVSAIVRLARALRLDVIAEGVETEAQRVRIAAAGCGDIQGFLTGRPMPLAGIERLLKPLPNLSAQALSA